MRTAVLSDSKGFEKENRQAFAVYWEPILKELSASDKVALFVSTVLFRNGQYVGPGVVVAVSDRILVGWTKGLFKKVSIESVPLDSITRAELRNKSAGGRLARASKTVHMQSFEVWEFLCSPEVSELGLYDTLTQLMDRTISPEAAIEAFPV